MLNVSMQALRIVVVGIALTVASVVLRGLPPLAAKGGAEESATCGAPVPAQPQVRWITQEQAGPLVEDTTNVAFVDARDKNAFESGHIAGALHVPMDTGTVDAAQVAMLRGFRTVIAYCDTSGGCARSSRLANLLANAGLRDVRVLEGGLPAWLERRYPAEAGACRLCP